MARIDIHENHPQETDMLRQLPMSTESLKQLFSSSADVVFNNIQIRGRANLVVTLVYVDGLANQKIIDDNIVRPLTVSDLFETCRSLMEAYQLAQKGVIHISHVTAANDMAEAAATLLAGKTLLCFDQLNKILILDTTQFEKRGITSATEESTFRSPKEGFVEALRVNTSMLRRKIGSTSLVLEETKAGRQSNTRICIAYMRNICNETFIEQIRTSIGKINQDKVLSLRDIEDCVTQQKYRLFPVALVTEKPDTCVRHLLDGKIAVMIAEMPYALIFPIVFSDFFKSSEDYAGSIFSNSFFRILRYISLMLTIALPGLYISVTTFHPEMLPYDLAIRIAAARSGVPFPVFVEAVIMSLSFYALIQASIMISQSVGSAVSIVGGLVLGQAAIVAGFVSPGIIVVIAAAAISSLAIPSKELSSICWFFQMMCMIFCGLIGLAGVVLTYLIFLYMLARLELFGVPYISPFADTKKMDLDDSFVKLPDNANIMRPRYLNPKNKRRMP